MWAKPEHLELKPRELLFSYSYNDIAELLGISEYAVKHRISSGQLEPGDLRSICVAWYQELRKQPTKVVPKKITYGDREFVLQAYWPRGPVRISEAARILGVKQADRTLIFKLVRQGVVRKYHCKGSSRRGKRSVWAVDVFELHDVLVERGIIEPVALKPVS